MIRTARVGVLGAILVGLCMTAASPGPGRATPTAGAAEWPPTPAGHVARKFIEAFHAPDEAVMREFTLEWRDEASLQRMSLEARMTQFRQMRDQLGTLEIGVIRESSDFEVEVLARSEKFGMWVSMTFQLLEKPPHKLAHFSMKPSPAPELETRAYEAWENLQDLGEQVVRDSGMPGLALAVVEGGEVVEHAVAGVRAVGMPDPVEIDDLFHIGSVTKSFTGTLIGALVESGALRWDATVGEVLDGVDMRPEYESVTLEQLLQHRAGVRPYTDDRVDEFPDLDDLASAEQRTVFVQQVLNDEPVGGVGDYEYSNAGYIVAAHMAERVTGRSYEQMMHDFILEPLGARTALFDWPASAERSNQPRGHYGSPPELRVQGLEEYTWHAYMNPPGGLSCTVADLGRYAAMHLRGLRGENGVLRAHTLRRLHTPLSTEGARENYASGWVIERSGKHWHNGSAGTFFSVLALYPDDDLAVVALTNCAGSAGPLLQDLPDRIRAAWLERAESR